jgi:hypothetical protein
MGDLLKFDVDHHSLHLYALPRADAHGNCQHCGIQVVQEQSKS